MKKTKVAFIPTQLAGVAMYRMINPAKYMNKLKLAKVQYPEIDLDDQNLRIWEQKLDDPQHGQRIKKDIEALILDKDIVVFQKFSNKVSLGMIPATQRAYPKKSVLTEIDDYMFNVPSWNMAASMFTPGMGFYELGIEQLLRSDGIITSTKELAKLYKGFNRKTYIVSNGIDFDWWGELTNKKSAKIRIGWAGANAHMGDLEMVFPSLKRVFEDFPQVEFYFIAPSSTFPKEMTDFAEAHKDRFIIDTDWVHLTKYPDRVKKLGFTIGIAPLRDCWFNRGKSAIRWMEYSCLGIPTVASNIGGQFNEVITEGETGFLAKPNEWYEKLKVLIENETLRETIGNNAQTLLKNSYTAENSAKAYADILKQIREDYNDLYRVRRSSTAFNQSNAVSC